MKLAIENIAKSNADNKVLMLGGMMEMGDSSIEEHKAIVKLINAYHWKAVVLVGGDFDKVDHAYTHFKNSAEAKEWMQQQYFTDATILVKGSRSMQMEKVLE
jgi:UDP-N-acetylmuramoyl-tripeptide--D-alanyl-D-alanine ligase